LFRRLTFKARHTGVTIEGANFLNN
jgi:hypothetical protein